VFVWPVRRLTPLLRVPVCQGAGDEAATEAVGADPSTRGDPLWQEDHGRCATAAARGLTSLLRGHWHGRLPEHVTPACGRANAGIAEPRAEVDGLSALDSLDPQACRNHRGVFTVHPHGLRARILDLAFIDDPG